MKTTAHGFARLAESQPHLFQVNPNVPASQALAQASLLLTAAHEIAEEVAQLDVGSNAWGAACLIEMARAVVDSVAGGMSADAQPVSCDGVNP
ncbi:MAG: DUF3077 domain-containing protein [Pigmentiphaga sp.]|nr:DUF3077 domain-containing protein [Pigmentiphaga sp.]